MPIRQTTSPLSIPRKAKRSRPWETRKRTALASHLRVAHQVSLASKPRKMRRKAGHFQLLQPRANLGVLPPYPKKTRSRRFPRLINKKLKKPPHPTQVLVFPNFRQANQRHLNRINSVRPHSRPLSSHLPLLVVRVDHSMTPVMMANSPIREKHYCLP